MLTPVNHRNQVYSTLSARRRYEVWFLRFGLADGSGAWWFRYLLMNPGRGGCANYPLAMPVQLWATWFPLNGKPQSCIQGFPLEGFHLRPKGQSTFQFAIGENAIEDNSCRGRLNVDGHDIKWDLHYTSTFGMTLSDKGWIGFSRTPHSDAVVSGYVILDGRKSQGHPLGFGLQGHNCGYRHRNRWTWAHAYFQRPGAGSSTFEAVMYDMPLGMVFRKAVLWHAGSQYAFRELNEVEEDRANPQWRFNARCRQGTGLEVAFDGRGPSLHRLPYVKTDCSGSFEVANNSLARATLVLRRAAQPVETLETAAGAVLEMGGYPV